MSIQKTACISHNNSYIDHNYIFMELQGMIFFPRVITRTWNEDEAFIVWSWQQQAFAQAISSSFWWICSMTYFGSELSWNFFSRNATISSASASKAPSAISCQMLSFAIPPTWSFSPFPWTVVPYTQIFFFCSPNHQGTLNHEIVMQILITMSNCHYQ